jgi:hypothetical protein
MCASITLRWDCVANQYCPIAHYSWRCAPKKQGVQAHLPHPGFVSELLLISRTAYHGMIFFNPFFFLLVDSFLLSFGSFLLPDWVPFCAAASGFVPSLVWTAGVAAPSFFAVPSAPVAPTAPSVFCVASLAPAAVAPFVGSLAAGGVAGSDFCASGFASVPSGGGVTLSAPLVVSAGPPGETVATIPVPTPPIRA